MPPKTKVPYKKRMAKKAANKKSERSLVNLIKKVSLAQNETKYMSKNVVFTNRVQNTPYAIRLWGDTQTETENVMPTQGSGDGNRIGDGIYCAGYKVRYNMELSGTFNDAHIKFFFLPYNSDQGDPLQRTQLTHDLSGFMSTDPIQTKRWSGIRYLGKQYVRATDATYTANKIVSGSFWIPIKKRVNFKFDTSNIPTNLKENGLLIWYMSGYNSLGADNQATSIVNCQFVSTIYFKDP